MNFTIKYYSQYIYENTIKKIEISHYQSFSYY